MTAKAIKLTAALIQRRDDMRRLLGERYAKRVADARAILRGAAAERKLDLADAALQICRELDAKGVDPSIIMAALVDESGIA